MPQMVGMMILEAEPLFPLLCPSPALSDICEPAQSLSLVKIITTNVCVNRLTRQMKGTIGKYAAKGCVQVGSKCGGSSDNTAIEEIPTKNQNMKSKLLSCTNAPHIYIAEFMDIL